MTDRCHFCETPFEDFDQRVIVTLGGTRLDFHADPHCFDEYRQTDEYERHMDNVRDRLREITGRTDGDR